MGVILTLTGASTLSGCGAVRMEDFLMDRRKMMNRKSWQGR